MRIQAEDGLVQPTWLALDDTTDVRVAVFNRRRKLAHLVRRAHSLPFALGHVPVKHERFGAATDGAERGAHAYAARFQESERFALELPHSRLDHPIRACFSHSRYSLGLVRPLRRN